MTPMDLLASPTRSAIPMQTLRELFEDANEGIEDDKVENEQIQFKCANSWRPSDKQFRNIPDKVTQNVTVDQMRSSLCFGDVGCEDCKRL
jgi:hypothetical protein